MGCDDIVSFCVASAYPASTGAGRSVIRITVVGPAVGEPMGPNRSGICGDGVPDPGDAEPGTTSEIQFWRNVQIILDKVSCPR